MWGWAEWALECEGVAAEFGEIKSVFGVFAEWRAGEC